MIREILKPKGEELVIHIPKEYVHKEVEVLVFPLSENESKTARKTSHTDNLAEFRKLTGEAREWNIRVPGNVDIDALIDEMNDADLF